ncbi:MAG: MarR family winged helix-turn-helix transcriptional regulator [Dehalogenimonas sp.]
MKNDQGPHNSVDESIPKVPSRSIKPILAEVRLEQLRLVTHRILSKELKSFESTREQASVILEVYRAENNITPTRLGKIIRRDAPTISKILYRMKKNGTVNLVNDLKYRNRIHIELTPKGQELQKKLAEWIDNRKETDPFSVLDKQETETLIRLIDKVEQAAVNILKHKHIDSI